MFYRVVSEFFFKSKKYQNMKKTILIDTLNPNCFFYTF